MPEHLQIQQSKNLESSSQRQVTPLSHTHVSNTVAIVQRARVNPKSLSPSDVLHLQRAIGNEAVGRLLSGIQNHSTVQLATVKRKEIPKEEELRQMKTENNIGMPDHLKAGVENLSGIDMSDVKVHYNSSKPAEVGALAYTQGTDIHVAPGQERHLPHETWHVVQQAQGRVKPTFQMKGVAVNNEEKLEHEADMMGSKAATGVARVLVQEEMHDHHTSPMVLQRVDGVKRETLNDFATEIYEEICEPLKEANHVAVNNLVLLRTKYPYNEQYKGWWDYFTQDAFITEPDKPLKEYPGPIWMWPLQASGSLPPQEQRGSFISMEPWMKWESSPEDRAQLNSFWELAKALARECAFLNAPPDLGTDPGAKDWLSINLELREQDYQQIPENRPFARAKRMKSIRGIKAHLSRFMVPSQPTSEVTQEPIPKDTEEPGAFGF
jgi:hypothetical protein